ncbi:MAG: hypothetical protein NT094_04195, partial [Candidatus Staskawiczbacteria bacterium]|nr:hypothetical protein [Candidatus Staskawiczbacteria bacterium]
MKKTTLRAIFFMAILFFGLQGISWGQQVVGSFPQMDGGYENQTAGNLVNTSIATGIQRTDWTVSTTSGTGAITSTGGRSGPKYVSFSNLASNKRLQSPTAANGAIVNATAYTIQFYYKSTAVANTGQVGVSPDGTTLPGTYVAISVPSTSGVWTKLTQSATSGNSAASPKYGVGVVRYSGVSATTIDIDDFVMYAGAVDNTAPNIPGAVTVNNPQPTTLDVSWSAPTGGVDGGGYVVVRYSVNPDAT